MGILKRARADPSHDDDEGDVDVYSGTFSGTSATVTFDEEFDEAPDLIVSSESGDAGWSAVSTTEATITGTDTDDYTVLAVGKRGGA